MASANEKGNALEKAVEAIERAIVGVLPFASDKTLIMESKKIVNVGGVHHEIDIFVTIDLGAAYKSVFIFECKNWAEAVGKNEIIVFSEKIKAVGAQHGTVVAKSFTADARAQAKRDDRVHLLIVKEHDALATPMPFDLHLIAQEMRHISIHFEMRASSSATKVKIDPSTAQVIYRGNSIDLQEYTNQWAKDEAANKISKFPSHKMPDAVYDLSFDSTREFPEGEFVMDGKDIQKARISVTLDLRVTHPSIISHFEVEGRGRYLGMTPVSVSGADLTMGFVSVEPLKPPELK